MIKINSVISVSYVLLVQLDEDDDLRHTETNFQSPVDGYSRESRAEVDDIVPDLVSRKTKHPYTQQSDADSAIDGMVHYQILLE